MRRNVLWGLVGTMLASCGGTSAAVDAAARESGSPADAAVDRPDAAPSADGPSQSCPRTPAPADRVRKVVVSHPYNATSGQADTYAVLELTTSGELQATATSFEMGRAVGGEIVFTPDGEVGLVAQDDGSLGVFRFDTTGAVQVVEARFRGSFYAASVLVPEDGNLAYVLDSNWRENGGGVYLVRIGCDGALTDEGQVASGKLPYAIATLADGRAVIAARDLLASAPGYDTHLVHLGAALELVGGASAFPEDPDVAVVSAAAVTSDGRYVVLADNGEYSGVPTRVAAVEVLPGGLRAAQLLDIEDPVAILPSPSGSPVLVVSGYGNAIFALDYDEAAVAPLGTAIELSYQGARPQLPGAAVMVRRGALAGRVLIAENLGVRQVAFGAPGSATDLGKHSTGSGTAAVVGALGVQP